MFVRVKTTPNSPRKSVQICSSVRKGDKISQRIVRHVGVAMDEQELESLKVLGGQIIEKIRREQDRQLPLFGPEALVNRRVDVVGEPIFVDLDKLREEQRIIEGVHEIGAALFGELGLNTLFGRSQIAKRATDVLRNVVLARLAQPVSKLRTAELLEEDFGIRLSVDRIYRMMDRLASRIDILKECIAFQTMGLLGEEVDVLLYDVTTLSFESQRVDELRNFGYSKDKKFNEVQVVLALATTVSGLPVWYEVFEGSTAETKTLLPSLDALRKRFNVRDVIVVADRAMLSSSNVAALNRNQLRYILGMRLRTMSQIRKQEIFRLKENSDLSKPFLAELSLGNSERLIIGYSPERAKKDATDRERAIGKLQAKLKSNQISTAALISNRGSKKFLSEEIKGTVSLNENKVKQDAAWDGIYGICTNDQSLSPDQIVAHYKSLWNIEHTFRITKHDLKIRPIYHWTPARVAAHCAICFLSLAMAMHLQYRVSLQQKPMSFVVIQNALLSVQSSILRDINNKQLYRVPSKLNQTAKKIYSAIGIKRHINPTKLT